MGDHEGWPQPNGLFPNGLLPNVAPSVTRDLDKERWSDAEERTAELIACIQPNQLSEERRNAVADYVQRLIMKCFDCQVFTFGSVPLKTYLPDGDIDLTAFSKNQKLKDSWANDVRDMLENEEKNENAEFHVKEVQYIQAEVKIIKCLVENIVVDISFNQLGGLCTLCFLEEVDLLIEQNHLFKRSIILIKAWCYYESRILGAHHGLISTYALETLVLYIFHVFNSSFAGPLEVLYRFLEFFSNFDWENFCVSLWGPVPISQLPDITAESPRKDGGELLLSKPFLDACSSVYSVYPVAPETQGQPFVSKHFNVVDPLRTNNNLGRSVSKGNFYRIRSAFAFGAKKLARLLECPKENIVAEVNQFFMNTWERHGSRYRPDVPSSDLWRLRPVDPEAVGVAGKQTTSSSTKKEESEKFAGKKHIPLHEGDVRLHNTSDIVLRNSNTVPCSVNRKAYGSQTNQNTSNSETAHNDHEHHPGYQFARAQSSPDLTASSGEASWRGKKSSKTSDSGKSHYATARSDSGRKRNLASGSSAHQGLHASNSDPLSLRHSSPEPSLGVGGVSSLPTGSSSYDHDDVSEPHQDLQQEDHDLINMIATARAHGYLGAINCRSSQMPVPLSSVVGYPQRHMAGINFPMIDSTWGTGVTSNLVSSQLSHYFNGLGLAPNQEDLVQPANDASGVTESNQDDSNDPGFLEDSDAASPHSLEYASSSRPSSSSNASTRGEHYRYQNSGAKNTYTSDTSFKSRYSPANEVNISKVSKPARDKRGRKTAAGGVVSNVYEKPKEGWPYEVDVPVLPDEVLNRELQNVSSRNSVSAPLGSGRMPMSYEASPSGSEPAIPVGPMLVGSGSRQIAFYPTGPPVPFVTMLPFNMYPPDGGNSDGSPRQFDREDGMLENGRTSISDRSPALSGFDPLKNVEQPPIFRSPSTVDISSAQPRVGFGADILNSDFLGHWKNLQYGRYCQDPRDPTLIYPPQIGPPVYLQGHFPWDGPGRPLSAANMGVFTQIMGYGPRFVPVSPMQPGSSRSSGVYQRYGEEVPRFRSGTGTYLPSPNPVPHRDRQSANRGQRGNYSHDRNEHEDNDRNWNSGPKQRNPARGQSKYDNRGQADKLSARLDRSASADGRRDRSWDSHRNEYHPTFSSQNLPLHSNTIHNPGNVAYNMYPLEAVNASNAASSMGGAGQPTRSVVMLYPYDQNLARAPSHEQLEFGSLGPVHLGSATDATQVGDGCISPGSYEQRHNMFKGTSPTRLSPDQPSSPRMRRGI